MAPSLARRDASISTAASHAPPNRCIPCVHPQPRVDTPEPPSRQPHLDTIDGIFAAAVLPEDHPHAIKFPGDKKPDLDSDIIRSPGLASKIRGQFRRRSVRGLRKEGAYDGDAQQLTSKEVLQDLAGEEVGKLEGPAEADGGRRVRAEPDRFGTAPRTRTSRILSTEARAGEGRTSVLNNFEWMKPLLQNSKLSAMDPSGESYTVVEVADRVAAQQHLAELANGGNNTILFDMAGDGDEPLFKKPKSPRGCDVAFGVQLRRANSACAIADHLSAPTLRRRAKSLSELPTVKLEPRDVAALKKPLPHAKVSESSSARSRKAAGLENSATKLSLAENGMRLHTMHISQQLRSMSRFSDFDDADSTHDPHWQWNLHQREKADVNASSLPSRHSKNSSYGRARSGMLAPSVFAGSVRPTSSIYSRPCSAGVPQVDAEMPPYTVPTNLDALFADWPLKPSASVEDSVRALGTVSSRSAASEHRQKPLPQSPDESREDSATELPTSEKSDRLMKVLPPTPADSQNTASLCSPHTANKKRNGSSVKFSSPPRIPSPRQSSKRSDSTLTKENRVHNQSPQRKTVRKRRSIFRFLRPRSRKQGARSISTPVLRAVTSKNPAAFDGPSDDPALLTVQYELDENPRGNPRSASIPSSSPGAPSFVAQRHPTMADYERTLSVAGDNRRRPSALNVHKIHELKDEEHRQSVGLRHRLGRARPLKDDASPLMANALQQHQQEKALFHSASKQRESIKASRAEPFFKSEPFAQFGSSLPPPSPKDHNDLLDPLEKGYLTGPMERSRSMGLLAPPPHVGYAGSSRRTSATLANSARRAAQSSSPPAMHQPSIGTSRDSWAQFPSHTRIQRCGSAGGRDAIFTRDFAVDSSSTQNTHDMNAGSPRSLPPSEAAKSKRALKKTRSLTFSGIKRYYSNLFTLSNFSGQNRRTSVTVGGRLEHPELELLPPQLPGEARPQQVHHTHYDYLNKVKEDVEQAYGYVKTEEDRVRDHMHTEENKFESFVRKEEDKFGKFVHDEEDKYKQHQRQQQQQPAQHPHTHHHHTTSKGSPFREDNFFAPHPRHSSHDSAPLIRIESNIGPDEDLDPSHPSGAPRQTSSSSPRTETALRLDGAAPSPKASDPQPMRTTPSYAEIWSDIYRECLAADPSNPTSAPQTAAGARTSQSLPPPPLLKLEKSRSPGQKLAPPAETKTVGGRGRVRKFPSVTVFDDRKGHWRSVSLVSSIDGESWDRGKGSLVKEGLVRESRRDLIEVIEGRERRQRDRLLRGEVEVDGGFF